MGDPVPSRPPLAVRRPAAPRRPGRRALLIAVLLPAATWVLLAPAQAAAECTAPAGREAVRLSHRSAVFEGPGPTHRVVGEVPGGACLRVEDRQADWFRVRLPGGGEAWLHQAAVAEVVAGPRRQPPRQARPQPRPQQTRPRPPPQQPPRQARPAQADPEPEVGDGEPSAPSETVGRWAASALAKAAVAAPGGVLDVAAAGGGAPDAQDVSIVLKSQSLLRAMPNDEGRILRVLQPETRLELVDIDRSGNWLHVRREGDAEGWLRRDAVRELPAAWRPVDDPGSADPVVPRPPPQRAPASDERMVLALGAGYLAVWQQVQTDVDEARFNYAIRGLAVGSRLQGTYWFGRSVGMELRYGLGFIAGLDVQTESGTNVQLAAVNHAGRLGPTFRLPLAGRVDGFLGGAVLLAGAGYHASALMVQRTNPVLFNNHLFHGGYLALGATVPVPGTAATLGVSGGPSLSTIRQWPYTTGAPEPVLGWHVEGGLQLPLVADSRLDLRYHAQGRDGWFEGAGTWDERIGRARTRESDHGLIAGIILSF